MINVKTIENTVLVEKPCDGRDGVNFALKVTSCTNTSVVCQESFRNPGDGNPRICQGSGNNLIFFLIPILFFFDPGLWGNCCISCSIVAEYFFLIPILIFFFDPQFNFFWSLLIFFWSPTHYLQGFSTIPGGSPVSVSFPIEEYALEALLAAAQCLSGKPETFRCPIEPVFWWRGVVWGWQRCPPRTCDMTLWYVLCLDSVEMDKYYSWFSVELPDVVLLACILP